MINVGDLYYKYDWANDFTIWLVIRKATYSVKHSYEYVMYNFMTGRITERLSQNLIETNFRKIS